MSGGAVRSIGDAPSDCLAGGGQMGALMRETDWSRTPLGPVSGWPQSLRTAVSICLGTSFPMMIAWGPELFMLYNDGYLPVLGTRKHPAALGQRLLDCFDELRDLIGPMFHGVLETGEQVGAVDMMFPIERHGYAEETYFVFSYSPIRDESGQVGGVLTTCNETTGRVIGERRLRALRALAEAAGRATTAEDALERAARTLDPSDTPFALLYLVEPGGERARLVASAGLEAGHNARVTLIELADGNSADWPLARAPQVVEGLDDRFGPLPGGPWPEPSTQAVLLPISRPGQPHPFGFLVAGLSPRRALDDDYRAYLDLVSEHIATAVANARTREEERSRVEALAELNRAKTTFFSNISHEFRTPLTLMIGPLEDLLAGRSGGLSRSVRDQIDLTHRNGLRLLKLVNTLLDFARMESGRMSARYEPVDLAALTAQIAGSFRSAIERAGLEFAVECEPIAAPVHVDVEMWEKIVLNLLSNALKFTFEGSIAVRLRERAGAVELEVADTGTGIRPEELANLFERFHRIYGTRSRTHEGSGIGLALVHDLVRLHGGTITCDSQLDRGTTFRATIATGTGHLPADQVAAARSAAARPAAAEAFLHEAFRWLAEPAVVPAAPESTARVLIADDNTDMRDYLVSILGARWQVTAVGNGAEALAEVARAVPDLVLTDVMMPLLDGFGLLRALRVDPRTAHVPVVMLSARAGEEARIEGLDAGADDYLVKPFSARELVARVGSQLALAAARRSLEAQRATLYSLFARLPAAVSIVRGESLVYEMVNDLFVELSGRRAAEVIGRPMLEVFPDLAGQDFLEQIRSVLRTGESFVGREAPIRFDGDGDGVAELTYWNFDLARRPDDDGRGHRVMSFRYDVSAQVRARRQVEEALASRDETLALLNATLEHAPVGLAFFDRDACYRSVNRALVEANGLPVETTIGRRVDEVLPGTTGEVARNAIIRAFETGEVVGPFELTSPPPAGPQTARHWLRTYYPVRDRSGAIIHVGAVVVDVTTQVRAREELERTVRYNEMFAGTLAHDLRNPLSAIVSGAHLVMRRSEDPRVTVPVGRIMASSDRMARMIDQLLDFTRIRLGGGLGLEPKLIDLAEVTRRVVDEVDAEQRRFDISQSGHALGNWDPDRLAQVISNLASNALQHGQVDGGLRIHLAGDRPSEVVVSFENAGAIPPELLPVLFDPFRGSANPGRNARGLGLGLFISREIVTAHGGTIDVASSASAGTRFTIVLPRAPVQ